MSKLTPAEQVLNEMANAWDEKLVPAWDAGYDQYRAVLHVRAVFINTLFFYRRKA